MIPKIIKAALRLCLPFLLCTVSLNSSVQAQTRSKSFRKTEPNVHAPELYANRIKIKLSLVDLPGAVESESYWEVSYQIYFISEASLQAAIKNVPTGGWNPTPADFPGRILLGQDTFRRNRLRTLADRTYLSKAIPLKAKVPDKMRTKFATILTSYSVKIFDARLQSNIYKAGTFAGQPFTEDPAAGGREIARTLLYANFYVNPKGRLFYSQRPRNSDSTTWP